MTAIHNVRLVTVLLKKNLVGLVGLVVSFKCLYEACWHYYSCL